MPQRAGSCALPFIDGTEVFFTVPESRFIVRVAEGNLEVLHVRYEIPAEECVAAVVPLGADETLEFSAISGHVDCNGVRIALLGEEARLWALADEMLDVRSGNAPDTRISQMGRTWSVTLDLEHPSEADDVHFLLEADKVVEEWMSRIPSIHSGCDETMRHCWWVLGANTIQLTTVTGSDPKPRMRRCVVPSKLGYVAAWQWDAYFIALGLAHGDPQLALEQLDVVFTPDTGGQLPDVVHDEGVLASSADLPPADRATLEAQGSRSGENGVVPLTKPPLGPWAAERVLSHVSMAERIEWMRRWYPILRASQDWWFRTAGDRQMPSYSHPYSSGLDDSPIFDGAFPVVSPDLLAYISASDEVLAHWAEELGSLGDVLEQKFFRAEQEELTARAECARHWRNALWDSERGMFAAYDAEEKLLPRTIVSLLGVFGGGVERRQLEAILSDIRAPERFGGKRKLPTVSRDEESFDPERMWRGPIWVNTNFLVAHGLCASGATLEGVNLLRGTLTCVEDAGGPVEYINPDTGKRACTATRNFGWSAGLYVEIACSMPNITR